MIWQSNISNVLTTLRSNGINYDALAYDATCEDLHWPWALNFGKGYLKQPKNVMTKKFWKLSNPWNLKKTTLSSNTITGIEYIYTQWNFRKSIKERYIKHCFKPFEKLRMGFAWYVRMFPTFESKLKVEDANNYHQAYNPLLTLLF